MVALDKLDFQIRLALPRELPAVIAFRRLYLIGKLSPASSEIPEVDRNPATIHVTAWVGTTLTGYVRFERHFPDEYFISRMVIHPSYRRQGIGRAVMDYGHVQAEIRAGQTFRLDARSSAREFYEKIGYVIEKNRPASGEADIAMMRATPLVSKPE